MAYIAQDSLANLYFTFTWKSSHATHVEHYLAQGVSFTRDTLPLGVKSRMLGLGVGDSVEIDMDPHEVPPFKPGKVLDLYRVRFQAPAEFAGMVKPRIGRFYPKHFIESVPGTRPDSVTPFRVVAVDKASFKADLNHPMAGREVSIRATVMDILPASEERGKLTRWPEVFFSGPGMQARLEETPTDYLGGSPFARENENDDAAFYAEPRMVQHMDGQALANVAKLYGSLLEDGVDVLDLMGSHDSHLPETLSLRSLTGLGLNRKELEANTALTARVTHDLNKTPALPFDDAAFDAVVCTASVEYLINPFEVVEEVGRVLRPGGVFALTFSNRWFAPKAIAIWPQLHEFERMGLVSQYLIRSEAYADVTTVSERGWPRPDNLDDRYAESIAESDPVYGVWGRKK